MTIRVRDILSFPELSLRLVGGAAGTGNLVRWVHVSDIEDPTPWLEGEELLLTAGRGIGTESSERRAYITRLVDARIAGLGMSVGGTFSSVPPEIVATADSLAFPVFEIPYAVPFVAIARAVISKLESERLDSLQRSLEAQVMVTRAVLEGRKSDGIVSTLAQAIDGWAVVFDPRGTILALSDESYRSTALSLWHDLKDQHPETSTFSLSVVSGGSQVVIQPIGLRDHLEGYLAVSKSVAIGQFDRFVLNHALSLLAVEFDKMKAMADTERRLRGDILNELVNRKLSDAQAGERLARFGFSEADKITVVAFQTHKAHNDLLPAVEAVLLSLGDAFLLVPRNNIVFALLEAGAPLDKIQATVSETLEAEVVVARGRQVAPLETEHSFLEASFGLRVCLSEGRSIFDAHSIGSLPLDFSAPDALRDFVQAILAPIERHDEEHGSALLESLRIFLECNRRWQAASNTLHIHRHTLAYRMEAVEQLTGRSLSSMSDVLELWLALKVQDILEP